MKKRILSILLSVVMLVSLLPTTALAIEAQGHTEHTHAVSVDCETTGEGLVEFTEWKQGDFGGYFPSDPGNYVLVEDVDVGSDTWVISSGVINLCLNGHTLTMNNGKILLNGSGTLSICDCSHEGSGLIKNIHNRTKEGIEITDSKAQFNLYGGNIYIESTSTLSNYTYGVSGDSAYINIYGGTITAKASNNKAVALNISSNTPHFKIYGGVMTAEAPEGKDAYGLYLPSLYSGWSNYSIEGGVFIGRNSIGMGNNANRLEVTGGIFSTDPTGVIDPSYTARKIKTADTGYKAEYDDYYVVEPASAAHEHNWTYAAEDKDDDGRQETIVATCNGDGTCEATNKELTIVAPLHVEVNDGKSALATLSADSVGGIDELPLIQYSEMDRNNYGEYIGVPTTTAPTKSGKFEASITVEGQKASVVYLIEKLDRENIRQFTVSDITNNSFVITLDEADWDKSDFVCQVGGDYIEFTPDENGKATITVPEAYAGHSNLWVHVCQKETDTYEKNDGKDATVSLLPADPTTYTVTFAANGGSGTMAPVSGVSGNYTLPENGFTAPAGKQFKAWKIGETEYAAGASITISANTIVTAVWEEITYSVSGAVQDNTSGTAQVTLMKGNTEVKTATVTLTGSDTNYTGTYSFTGVAPGVYNIVVTKGNVIMTVLVKVVSSDVTVNTITMPSGSKNSVLDNSRAGDFAATVGGLDKIAANENIQNGQSVEIKLTVKAEEANNADPEQTAIKAQASGKTLKFIDLSLTKKINSGVETDYGSENTQLLTIVIPFVQGNKQNITVFRYHGSGVDILTTTANGEEEKIEVGDGFITIYAKRFSTYAIGYTMPAVNPPSGGGDYTPTYAITVEKAENGEVKANRSYAAIGSTVTITVDPETGYVLNKLTVTDERGNNIEVTDKGDGTFTFKMPGRKVTVEASFAAVGSYSTCPGDHTCPIWPYTDAETTAWYHDGVHYCIENGLMTGYGDGIFKPNADTTRAMITVMLWRLNGSPVVNDLLDFEDVEEGQWYTEAIRWAKSEGIAEGYGNGCFGTNDAITREQMVTILWRYAQYKGIDVSVGEDTNILSYNDAFDVAEYAITAMQWACGSGMVQGKNDPNGGMILDPESKGTRAQIATMMMRFCTEIVK